jgi:murein DD-endopeptidase MepM/ murein hydrolase activator NlpD
MQINQWGLRADGFLPADPAQYAIFGTPVYAPCDGTVIRTENNREDMPPPLPDREVIPGNHVLLDCGEFIVLLAHFKKGSVAVGKGQTIETGQMLGEIGNSGNTNEPHLHIHAQRRGTGEMPLDGEPLWMTFEGKFLVRNQLVVR